MNKQCTNNECSEWFPNTEEFFYKQKQRSKSRGEFYTLSSWCRNCCKKKSHEYQLANRDRSYISKTKWYENNKEFAKQLMVDWRLENVEHKQQYQSEYQQSNPDKVKEYNESRNQNRKHEISEKEWTLCKLYFENSCAYCDISELDAQKKYKNRLHRDHVDHEGENDLSNCVPACKSCNSRKHDSKLEDWYSSGNYSFSQFNLEKIYIWINGDYLKFITTNTK